MKKVFTTPELEIIRFQEADIIVCSTCACTWYGYQCISYGPENACIMDENQEFSCWGLYDFQFGDEADPDQCHGGFSAPCTSDCEGYNCANNDSECTVYGCTNYGYADASVSTLSQGDTVYDA